MTSNTFPYRDRNGKLLDWRGAASGDIHGESNGETNSEDLSLASPFFPDLQIDTPLEDDVTSVFTSDPVYPVNRFAADTAFDSDRFSGSEAFEN